MTQPSGFRQNQSMSGSTMSSTAFQHGIRIVSLGAIAVLGLTSCTTPQGELVSETPCTAATALAQYGWEVAYFPERFRQETTKHRIETFASAELLNRNGLQPEGENVGPDDQGIWWPLLPPRPTADEVDARRQDNSRENDPPQLQRSVRYVLDCEDGKFATTDEQYRRFSRALRDGKTVRARYSLGQLLSATIADNAGASETIEVAPKPSSSSDSDSEVEAPSSSNSSNSPTVSVLYVDSAAASDGNGSSARPYTTITQALSQAEPGMIVQLSSGAYGSDAGETLPLELPAGVILQGDPATQGQEISIIGGGDFISPTWARQNVTVVATDQSQIVGLTLSNPNVRGSAIWVEAGSPLILKNTFIDNHREAVFVSGQASPRIESNLIRDNGGNGIAFTRDSGGSVTGNSITRSGYGVVVGDRATPLIEANQIADNRSGMVISGNASPTLRGNTISDSEEDGIVITNSASPQLESNILLSNGDLDIRHSATGALQVDARDLLDLKVETSTAQSELE